MGIGSKLFQSFRNLKPDAVPRPPRPETLNVNSEVPETSSDKDEDTASIQEEIIIEPDDEDSKDEKKSGKRKKSFPFFTNKKDRDKTSNNKHDDDGPASPVNTQATGNVINIVNSSNVHWGNVIHNNLSGGNSNKEQKYDDADMEVKKTKSIIQVLEADIKLEHVYIDYVAKNLGRNWHSFFKALGYTKGRIETMEIDEARNGVSEARYKLLLDWTRNDDDGTLGKLATMLWQEGERVIVKELAIIYKNISLSKV